MVPKNPLLFTIALWNKPRTNQEQLIEMMHGKKKKLEPIRKEIERLEF